MIIDISSYQGVINWSEVLSKNNIDRVILRSTTRYGALDTMFMENYNGLAKNSFKGVFDVYKFSYAKTHDEAIKEAKNALETLKNKGVLKAISVFWLDLENINGVRYTRPEAAQVITAYRVICELYGVEFGIYANYDYVKNILPDYAAQYPLWLARYNSITGDVKPFNIEMWQYTSNGKVAGINGNVDLSKYVKGGKI